MPSNDASPLGGALNNTMPTPPNATSANTSARRSLYSVNSLAPIGTMKNGASEPISAALATLLCVAPAKKMARFRPKKTPGISAWRTCRIVTRRPVLHRNEVPDDGGDGQPPERDEHTGRLSPLHERRAEREGDDDAGDRERPQRPRAQCGNPPSRGAGVMTSATMTRRGPLEAVEDEVEPELVLVAVVVAGLEDVLDGQLGEVRVLVGGNLRQDRLGQLGRLLPGVERQARLLQREPVDVAVEDARTRAPPSRPRSLPSRRLPITASWCRSVAGPG